MKTRLPAKTIDEVINACEADVNDAVEAAKKSVFTTGRWSGKTPSERSAVLNKMADLIAARMDELGPASNPRIPASPYEYLCKGVGFPLRHRTNLRFFRRRHPARTSGNHAGRIHARVYLHLPP